MEPAELMKIRRDHEYAHNTDTVFALFTDAKEIKEKQKALGARDIRLEECERDSDGAVVRFIRELPEVLAMRIAVGFDAQFRFNSVSDFIAHEAKRSKQMLCGPILISAGRPGLCRKQGCIQILSGPYFPNGVFYNPAGAKCLGTSEGQCRSRVQFR